MKIERIAVENFLGLKRVDIAFGPITAIAGDNWSGKSSLQQALRLALSGQVERVTKKGEYHALVRDGAKKAQIQVATDAGVADVCIWASKTKNSSSAVIPVCQDPAMVAFLNQHRFSEFMDLEQRRELLFQVGGIATAREEVERRLLAAEVPPELVEEVGPLLIQGFDGAVEYVAEKLKQLRAAWKEVAGETYGSQKAAGWKAEVPQPLFSESSQIAAELPKREESLALAVKQEADQQTVVDRLNESAHPDPEKCEKCDRKVSCIDEDAQDAREALPRQSEALAMLQRATGNRRAAVDEAKNCAAWIALIDTECQKRTELATATHGQIADWSKLAELIAWEGIPSELAGKVVKQINERLAYTASLTRWPIVQLREDMEITVGSRLWGLCSEAERWTADAALCEALAWVSGHKILVLDRMDVLQPFRRGDLFDWLDALAVDGVQSIVFATLKGIPKAPGLTSYWMEAGEVAPGK